MDTLQIILVEIGKGLLPLRQAVQSKEDFYAFMLNMGWEPDDVPQPLRDLAGSLDDLIASLRKIVGAGLAIDGHVQGGQADLNANVSLDDINRAKNAIEHIVNGIRAIATAPDALIPAKLRNDGFREKFPKQLIDYLLVTYLTRHQAQAAFLLRSLGVVKFQYVPGAGNRPSHMLVRIDFADLPKIFSNPAIVLQNAFGWGTDAFNFGEFAYQVENLLMAFGLDIFMDREPARFLNRLEESTTQNPLAYTRVMRGIFFERARTSGRMAAEIRLMGLRGNGSQKPGIALMPAFNGLLNVDMNLNADLRFKVASQLNLQGGLGLVIRPGQPVRILTGFLDSDAPTTASGSLTATVERTNADGTPVIVFGSTGKTRLEFRTIAAAGGIRLAAGKPADVFTEFQLRGLKFVLKPDGDGFITKLLPGDGIRVETELTLGVSYLVGFYFQGSASLEIQLPTHISIGPLELQGLTIALRPAEGRLPLEIGATIKGELGPLKAIVENIGLSATFSFPPNGGNAGPLDIQLSFKPPNGVGLSIDVGIVKGGGFLGFYPERSEYSGFLELTLAGFISVKAIGLITTRMPDGSDGFSLLLILTAEFTPPFQLGYGFTLIGVGGLLGLNRTVLLDPLRDGVRTGAVNSIMFPQNIIENAPRIISDLRAIFPPYDGHFLIGPMLKAGWGTPTLISLALGVIVEIPGNIAILGVLKIVLPDENAALIRLQVNFIGTIDFQKKMVTFDASLYESRILTMTLEGDMAVRVLWGDNATFLLSVGGFHPSFTPPPLGLPTLRRIAIDILNQPLQRIRVEGYFAVTSNTVQFGARAELTYGFSDCGITGFISFDALFQFSPFYFIIEIRAGLSIDVFGFDLLTIRLQLALEGVSPWRARGSGSVGLFLFSVDVDFDTTWGDARNTALPDISIYPKILDELAKKENWRALLPPGNNLLVSLRNIDQDQELVLHPVGALTLIQRLLPLDFQFDKVGHQKPSDVNRVAITHAESGGQPFSVTNELESFAPAQFKKLDDAARLSSASFQKMNGGVRIGLGASVLQLGKMIRRTVAYELTIIDIEPVKPFKKGQYFIQIFSLFTKMLKGNSVSKSVLSQQQAGKLQPFSTKIKAGDEGFTIAFTDTNRAVDSALTFTSEAMAAQHLAQTVQRDYTLANQIQVVSLYEVNAP